jgi:multidrug efflux pump subunit AcrB
MAVIPTFVFMWLFGGTINLMSLGGLAVAIGLVIDDAVVVVENIHRRAGEGSESVINAVQQLMAPLVSSTLTTVVVFAPLGLLSGVPGQFFRALSMSLSVAVLISLALSISVVPRMARWAQPAHRPAGEWHGRVDAALSGCSDGWSAARCCQPLCALSPRHRGLPFYRSALASSPPPTKAGSCSIT